MKSKTVLHGLCASCGGELGGGYPRFFMPIGNHRVGEGPSKQVCATCFTNFLKTIAPDGVELVNDPDFYGGDMDPDDGSPHDPVDPSPDPPRFTFGIRDNMEQSEEHFGV